MTYRAEPVTQRDGSALANSNCRMASISTGLDYHTQGVATATAAAMRSHQSDQSGGTDSGDAAEAWAYYGQELRIRDGSTFDDALEDLAAGRLVHLDVWAASVGGPCLSGDGGYGHTIAVAPERSGTRWLTADPWCSPGHWVWWDEALLRAGAEDWGGMTYSAATAGRRGPIREAVLIALMRLAAKRLMTAHRPDLRAIVWPHDTGGAGGRIMYTTTAAHGTSGGGGEPPAPEDVMFNIAPSTTHRAAIVRNCAELYSDSSLTTSVDTGSESQPLGFVGSTSDAHLVAKGDSVLYVRRADVLSIVAQEIEHE